MRLCLFVGRRLLLLALVQLFDLADHRSRRARAAKLLRAVRLGERHLALLPAQISGGERQRVAIACHIPRADLLLLQTHTER